MFNIACGLCFFACKDCLFPDSALIMHTCSNVSVEEWMKKIVLLLVSAVLLLSGCVTHKVHYEVDNLEINTFSQKGFTLGVVDARPYVVNREKLPAYSGRVGQGPVWELETATGYPLADDFASSIRNSLAKKGIEVKVVPFIAGTAKNNAVVRLLTPARKSVLIVMKDWRAISVFRFALFYDLTISVYDETGQQLTEKNLMGTDIIPDEAIVRLRTSSYWGNQVVPFYRKKLEELFSDPEIAKYL